MSKPTPSPWHLMAPESLKLEANGFMVIAETARHAIRGIYEPDKAERDNETAYALDKANADHIVKCVNMHEELIREIKSVLDNFNPKECSCDGEYEEGRLVGHACYFHRNEEILRNLLAKAEGK